MLVLLAVLLIQVVLVPGAAMVGVGEDEGEGEGLDGVGETDFDLDELPTALILPVDDLVRPRPFRFAILIFRCTLSVEYSTVQCSLT